MCLIVDANKASQFFSSPPSAALLQAWNWVNSGKGRLVIGGKLLIELEKNSQAKRAIISWSRAGHVVRIPKGDIETEEKKVFDLGICSSNDLHILALARKSCGRILCSDDVKLQSDFTNKRLVNNPRGKIYAGKVELLRKNSHRNCRASN